MPDRAPLSRLDLNLLVSLDALLAERSVTKAAERLHLSQPALSASLARLRAHFGDAILARRGNMYELTPLAIRLAEQTSTALEAARRVFEAEATWDPATSTREFAIYSSDYALATVGAAAALLARRRAPGVRFRFMLHSPAVIDDVEMRLRSVDGLLIPHGFLTSLPFVDLWKDGWTIVADAGNDRARTDMSMDLLAASPWVFTYQSATAFTSAGRQLQQLGIEPRVETVVESFLALPQFIAGTDRLGLIQSGLAPLVESMADVHVIAPPFDVTPLSNALWWHPNHNRDPEHEWMRALFVEAAQQFAAAAQQFAAPDRDR